MTDQTRIRFGRGLSATSLILSVAGMGVLAVLGLWGFLVDAFVVHIGLLAVGLAALAWTTIPAQPRNGAIWALAWASFFGGLLAGGAATTVLLTRALMPGLSVEAFPDLVPADLPLPVAIAVQPFLWAWIPAFLLALTLGLLLFPDGRPPSPRWKWVGWFSVAAIAVAVADVAVAAHPWSTLTIDTYAGGQGNVTEVAINLATVGALLSVASLVVRYRRSSGVARQQIRWIAWGGSFLVGILAVSTLVEEVTASGGTFLSLMMLVATALLVLSFFIAITKYRLYDIDVVISRTVSYGFLAVFITGVYVAVVVGLGSLIGQSDEPNLALAIGATAVVALLFEPVRSRVQGWANRLVYGERASPYEVLTQLTVRLADTQSSDQALSRLAALIATGTGSEQSVVPQAAALAGVAGPRDDVRRECAVPSPPPRGVLGGCPIRDVIGERAAVGVD